MPDNNYFQARGAHTLGGNQYRYRDIFVKATGTAAAVIMQGPGIGTALVQMASNGTIEAVSAEAADTTQWLTLVGINTQDQKVTESFKLNGATAVEATSPITFKYFEYAFLSAKCAGIVTIRMKTGPTTIITISAGHICTPVAHFFAHNGEGPVMGRIHLAKAYATTNTAAATLDLRVYPTAAAARDLTLGYVRKEEVLTLFASQVVGFQAPGIEDVSIEVPGGGYACMTVNGNNAAVQGRLIVST